MKPAQLLISFARHRKRAYKVYGALDREREKAVERILYVCGFFVNSNKSGWAHQIKDEIETLMPDPDSKDAHWRDKINQLFT